MNRIVQYLNQHIAGNVFDKMTIRDAYSTDYSILRYLPRFVAIPENTEDIRKLVRFSNELAERKFKLPITVRGNGHDKTGAAIGSGMIISMEKLNQVCEIDPRDRLVRVQAGATLGTLNQALAVYGLIIPIAGHDDDTIGGLIATCPTDNYSGKFGGIYHYLNRAEIVLSNGDLIQTKNLSSRQVSAKCNEATPEGRLYRDLNDALDDSPEVTKNLRKNPLGSTGYASASLLRNEHHFDLLPVMCASQGTLGIITEVILHCEIIPSQVSKLLIGFGSIRSAIDFLNFAKTLSPLELNLYDGRIFELVTENGKKTALSAQKFSSGYVVLISFAENAHKNRRLIKKCLQALPSSAHYLDEEQSPDTFSRLSGAITSFLNDDLRGERAPLANDFFVPNLKLASFITELSSLEEELHLKLPFFGSYSGANYSILPEISMDTITGRQFALRFLHVMNKYIEDHEGTLTGGAPEGALKSPLLHFSKDEQKFYRTIKTLFDPNNIFNPHVKMGTDLKNIVSHLRTECSRHIISP